jgi:osmotically-inducible protein OsmY
VVDAMQVREDRRQAQHVETAIRNAFARHAQRDVDHIRVDVVDQMVTLSGYVHSWAERQAAIGAAWGTRGIRQVIDRLRIEPYRRQGR